MTSNAVAMDQEEAAAKSYCPKSLMKFLQRQCVPRFIQGSAKK
ncbi:hypothetical protein GGQ73_003476 [Rhizobium skierniewicense]|uniref:Uncharacterized protein n=1 Tax=Rhizobium skierniewicense TaxID=984260 RepID=A0A7W6G3G7_9HYPH|nr:hypothetical protein [Rhizobium skierniewicense]UVY99804.1 hypothetical protein K4M19_00114 [Agrobacterium fabrum]